MQNDNNVDKIKQYVCKGVCEWGALYDFLLTL